MRLLTALLQWIAFFWKGAAVHAGTRYRRASFADTCLSQRRAVRPCPLGQLSGGCHAVAIKQCDRLGQRYLGCKVASHELSG